MAYQRRHACLSLWLSMGISPALVARWASHGIKVLLAVCASWIFGEEEAAMDRIQERPRDRAGHFATKRLISHHATDALLTRYQTVGRFRGPAPQ